MWKVNIKGRNKAITLINSDDIDYINPISKDGQDTIYLAIDSENKNQFKYPIACLTDNKFTLYKSGIEAAKKDDNKIIVNAADMLLSMVDEKKDKACPECGASITDEMEVCPDCKTDLCGTKKKKKDSADIQRYDFYDFDTDAWLEEKFKLTPDGYLTGRAIITNIGVFSYMNTGGTIRRELRLPDEVMNKESLGTLKSKPITNNHPNVIVSVDNVKEYQVGFTGDDLRTTPYHVSVPVTFTDKKTIDEDIKTNGKRAFSAGYLVNLDETSGVWLGVPYDAIQRNIRYNHVALVEKGRAGDAAKMKMDGLSNSAYRLVGDSNNKFNNDGGSNMPEFKKFTIDGVEYQAEGRVLETLNTEKNRADGLKVKSDAMEKDLADTQTKLSATEAERDTLKAKLDKAESDLAAAKLDDSKIKEAVEKKLNLLTAVYDVGIEVKSDETDQAIMSKIIAKAFPDIKLDGKDNTYIQGMFDGAIEILQKQGDNLVKKTFVQNTDGKTVVNVDEAKKNMIARITGANKEVK